MKLTLRNGLSGATGSERLVIHAFIDWYEVRLLEAEVGALCAAAPLGIAECSGLSVDFRLCRWGRHRGFLLIDGELTVRLGGHERREPHRVRIPKLWQPPVLRAGNTLL